MFICRSALVLKISIQIYSDINNCKNTSGTVSMLPDGGRSVVATFSDLTENRMYSASVYTHYDGGMLHHSQAVDIGEYVYKFW